MYLKYDPFRKRSVGASINLTFALLRGHAKDIFSVVLPIAGPAALIYFISIFFLQEEARYMVNGGDIFADNINESLNLMGQAFITIFAYMAFTLLAQLSVYAWARKAYESDRAPVLAEVWRLVRKSILPLIGTVIIFALLGGLAAIAFSLFGMLIPFLIFLIFIPIVYVLVRFSLFPVAIVMEDRSVDSLGRSWRLVADNWWPSFGFLFLLWLISVVLGFTLELPLTIINGADSYFDFETVDPASLEFTSDTWYIALSSLLSILVVLLTTLISGLASVSWFGNLVDRKENVGIQRDIEASMQSEQSSEQEGEY
ncbi:hypothetical protein [Croceimicrobium sp.]|uniref:DUF7847 domain-containing protein n=1 Tax=Croceimicrobium sp. TaxID=2828340 RepID=UPI003BAA8E7B